MAAPRFRSMTTRIFAARQVRVARVLGTPGPPPFAEAFDARARRGTGVIYAVLAMVDLHRINRGQAGQGGCDTLLSRRCDDALPKTACQQSCDSGTRQPLVMVAAIEQVPVKEPQAILPVLRNRLGPVVGS